MAVPLAAIGGLLVPSSPVNLIASSVTLPLAARIEVP